MDEEPQNISTLIGREVYSRNGIYIGEIEDIQLNIDGCEVTGIALGNTNNDAIVQDLSPRNGALLPYRWVNQVGDIVLLNKTVEVTTETKQNTPLQKP